MARSAIDDAMSLASQQAHAGPIISHVAGRTDHIPLDVRGESFVVPADVVSALGEGNTLNGMEVLKRMFGPQRPAHKDGGTVPIMAAGGEYVLAPETVAAVGSGDVKRGHQILRHFVLKVRKRNVNELKKMPGPVR